MASLAFIFFRLQLLASPWLRGKNSKELSWEQWVEFMTPRGRISRMVGLDKRWRMFMQDVCIPLFSAVCTAPRNDVENHPAEEFLGAFFRSTFSKSFRHLGLMWCTLILRFHMAHISDTPLRRLTRCSRCRCAALEPYSGLEDPPWRSHYGALARPHLPRTRHNSLWCRRGPDAAPWL